MADLPGLRQRRGVSRASIMHLSTKIGEVESRFGEPGLESLAQKLLERLESLDSDFKTQHLVVVDSHEEGSDLDCEQDILDQHDDEVHDLSTHLERLINASPRTNTHSMEKIAGRRLEHLCTNFEKVSEAVGN